MNKPSYEDLEKQILELKKVQVVKFSNQRSKQREDRFNLMLQASDDMITIHKKTGEYLYYNGPTCYAVNPEDIIGKMPSDIFDENATNTLLKAFEKVSQTGKSETIEVLLDWKGEKKWFSEYIYPVKNETDEVVEMVKICRDINKRKIAEQKIVTQNKKLLESEKQLKDLIQEKEKYSLELLKAKDRAEESDRLKSAFLANMSHEIRTPMNGILGFSELLRKENISAEKREDYLNVIEKEGKRLLTFISDIVDISKIESNIITINNSSCKINLLIDDLYTKYSAMLANTTVKLQTKKGLGDIESIIKTDSNKLVQILSNLLENAIKFTEEGIIELGYSLSNNKLTFYVKDSGVGIEIEEQSIIFDRFTQGKDEHTYNMGVGLGLSIVKGLTEIIGGKVWVNSEIGLGSTFFISIPFEHIDTETKVILDNNNETLNDNHLTILIAEDEFIIFMYLRECLSDFNCTILHASNGEKAVEMFKQNLSIDFILMDINMPKMNGYEALENIRLLNKEIPIIAQTGLVMPGDKEKMIAAGFDDYISKPISINTLITTINKNLKSDQSKKPLEKSITSTSPHMK